MRTTPSASSALAMPPAIRDDDAVSSANEQPSIADLASGIASADAHHVKPSPAPEPFGVRSRRARDAGCWFMPKTWGGGWTPVSWQGWLVTALSTVAMLIALMLLDRRAGLVCLVAIVVVTLAVAEVKGHPVRGRER